MSISRTLLLTASLLLSAIAFADDVLFESLDTDGNEFISQSEAQAHRTLAELFVRLDVNEDGLLSKAEYEQLSQKGQSND